MLAEVRNLSLISGGRRVLGEGQGPSELLFIGRDSIIIDLWRQAHEV